MIILESQNNKNAPRIAVVGCLHGNEVLGMDLYKEIQPRIAEFDNLIFIIANVEAYKLAKRFIDQDLNRCFPGDKKGNKEQQIAARIYELVKDADCLIDIHTTTSPGFKMAAITSSLTNAKMNIITLFGAKDVVVMSPELISKSLIGNTKVGVSLEYGLSLGSQESTVAGMATALMNLQKQTGNKLRQKFNANVYDLVGAIPKNGNEHLKLANFKYSKELSGCPFILDEKNYTDKRGFLVRMR
jgi:predicted deacylase